MKKYLLLVKGSFAKWNQLSEERKTDLRKQFGVFAKELGQLNYLADGDGCNERSFRIKSANTTTADCLVPPEDPDMVTGYFMLQVPDEQTALAWARKCPAFQCDEYVELIPCGDL